MSAARKPVIVRKLTRDWYAGYATAYPNVDDSELELLDNSGKLVRMAWETVKWVCYVRDLDNAPGGSSGDDTLNPERLLRRRFASRPRMPGLWIRMTLSDGEELEGVAANDRSLVDGSGLLLTPPDTRSNTQRIFVPRGSIRELTVLAVIGNATPSTQRISSQPELFENEQVQ